jgi:hypothetical protein
MGIEDLGALSAPGLAARFREAPEEEKRPLGKEVMGRLLSRVGLAERAEEPLKRSTGEPIVEDGAPLAVVDYMRVADRHGAAAMILNFIQIPEGHEKLPTFKAGLRKMILGYLDDREPNSSG